MKKGKLISLSLYEDFQVPGIEDIWVPLGHLKFAHRFLVVIVPCFVLSIRERWGGRLKGRGKSKFSEFCTMVRREYFRGQCFLLLCVFSKVAFFKGREFAKNNNFSSEIFSGFLFGPESPMFCPLQDPVLLFMLVPKIFDNCWVQLLLSSCFPRVVEVNVWLWQFSFIFLAVSSLTFLLLRSSSLGFQKNIWLEFKFFTFCSSDHEICYRRGFGPFH